MSKTYTITLPDNLDQALTQILTQTQQTPEETILQLLTQSLTPPLEPDLANDPLFKLIGCIDSDIPDIAENHDYYIGQALYEEMHPTTTSSKLA
jgi:hypothetical protein